MEVNWRGIKINEIKSISGVGGKFGGDDPYTYFTVVMKDGKENRYYFEDRNAYKHRKELKKLFNEYNNVPEYYLLENEMFVEVGFSRFKFGCRVENNLDSYEYLTNTQIERLKRQGKIKDEGWRHMLYICPLKIENMKIIRGELTEAFKEELEVLGIEYEAE